MLKLRSVLEGAVTLPDDQPSSMEGAEMQIEYEHVHIELNEMRKRSATLSSRKVRTVSDLA